VLRPSPLDKGGLQGGWTCGHALHGTSFRYSGQGHAGARLRRSWAWHLAILAHAEGIQPVGEKHIRPGLIRIKRVGLELGILQAEDLPDVKIREIRLTP
jgi:hypothetical protein